jgi:hypothetical protein
VIRVTADREPGQDLVGVLATLGRDVGTEDDVHLRQPGQLGRLIDRAGAGHIPVDFLERHQVWFDRTDHSGNSFQVELPIDRFAVVDVVVQDLQPRCIGSALYGEDDLLSGPVDAHQSACVWIVSKALAGERDRLGADQLQHAALLGQTQTKEDGVSKPLHKG